VNVLALTSISSHVRLSSNLTTRNPRKIGLYVKGEGTKLLHVDALAFAKIFVQVCDERLPDDLHLRFWLKRWLARVGPLCGEVVFSWVDVGILEDVVDDAINRHAWERLCHGLFSLFVSK